MAEEKALSTEVNLSDAAKALREKIQSAFVELIPPEQWETMVKNELESFVKGRNVLINPGYSRETRPAPSVFHEVCEQLYREHIKKLVKTELEKPEWNAGWDGFGSEKVSPAVKEWLTENSGKLLHTVLQEMFESVAQRFVQSLRHS